MDQEKVLEENTTSMLPDYLRELQDPDKFLHVNGLRPRNVTKRREIAQYNARLNDWGGLAPISDDLEEVLDDAENLYGLKGPIVYFNLNAHSIHGSIWVAFVEVGEATNLRVPASKLLGTTFGHKIASLQIKAVEQGETFKSYHHFVPYQFRK